MNHETSITKFFHIDKSLQASYPPEWFCRAGIEYL
jgi:hypothetical protein